MTRLISPVEKKYEKIIQSCPQGVEVNNDNEIFILNTTTQTINVYNIEDFTQTYAIYTNLSGVFDIWYLPCCDGILFQDRDANSSKTFFKICINWRNKEYFTPGKVENVYFPKTAIFPTAWQFKSLEQYKNETIILCISAFEPNLNPTAQIHDNSIFIISEKMCLIFDYNEKPELRVAIILPLPLLRPLFSFFDDYLAIIAAGNMFILKIVKGELPGDLPPFTPGNCCFDLLDNLNVDFGLSETQAYNFLFVTRYLPSSPHHIEILFRFFPPGLPVHLKFLSKSSVVLLTDKAAVVCRVRKNDRDKEQFDICNLSSFTSAENCLFNNDYIILTGHNTLKILPNPEKSNLDLSTFQLPELYSEELDEIQYTQVTKNHLFVVTSSRKTKTSKVIGYSIGNCEIIADAALSSNDTKINKIGVSMIASNNSKFAEWCYNIGNALFDQKGQLKEAIDFYIAAINAKKPISGQKRKFVIERILGLSQTKQIRSFIEQTFFLEDDINDKILEFIKQLPRDAAIRKLIRSRRFNIEMEDQGLTIEKLYKAVSLCINNKHEEARELFKECDIKQIKGLDFEILNQISRDLLPQVLIQIDQPDLPNDDWPYNERMFLYYFLKNDQKKALDFASKIGGIELHISEWPIKVETCDWLNGDNGDHLAAFCAISFDSIENPPEMFKEIIFGIAFAKKNRFADALKLLEKRVNKIKFLRYFGKTAHAWTAILNQINDPEVNEYGQHFFLSFSPSDEFEIASKTPPDIKGIDDLLNELNQTDNQLLRTITPTTGA